LPLGTHPPFPNALFHDDAAAVPNGGVHPSVLRRSAMPPDRDRFKGWPYPLVNEE
jgi:hypothetical protein